MSGPIGWRTGALRAAVAALALAAAPDRAAAQDDAAPAQLTTLSPPVNGVYDDATRFRRLQTRIAYIDTLEGPIPMDGAPAPPVAGSAGKAQESGAPISTSLTRLALAALALALAVALWRARHGLLERFGRRPGGGVRAQAGTGAGGGAAATPDDPEGFLGAIRARRDREAALVELTRAALAAAAAANGMRLGRSETARELLRRLPRGWAHSGALTRLVRVEELVQFGGRPLGAETFDACLDAAAPILRAGRPA